MTNNASEIVLFVDDTVPGDEPHTTPDVSPLSSSLDAEGDTEGRGEENIAPPRAAHLPRRIGVSPEMAPPSQLMPQPGKSGSGFHHDTWWQKIPKNVIGGLAKKCKRKGEPQASTRPSTTVIQIKAPADTEAAAAARRGDGLGRNSEDVFPDEGEEDQLPPVERGGTTRAPSPPAPLADARPGAYEVVGMDGTEATARGRRGSSSSSSSSSSRDGGDVGREASPSSLVVPTATLVSDEVVAAELVTGFSPGSLHDETDWTTEKDSRGRATLRRRFYSAFWSTKRKRRLTTSLAFVSVLGLLVGTILGITGVTPVMSPASTNSTGQHDHSQNFEQTYPVKFRRVFNETEIAWYSELMESYTGNFSSEAENVITTCTVDNQEVRDFRRRIRGGFLKGWDRDNDRKEEEWARADFGDGRDDTENDEDDVGMTERALGSLFVNSVEFTMRYVSLAQDTAPFPHKFKDYINSNLVKLAADMVAVGLPVNPTGDFEQVFPIPGPL